MFNERSNRCKEHYSKRQRDGDRTFRVEAGHEDGQTHADADVISCIKLGLQVGAEPKSPCFVDRNTFSDNATVLLVTNVFDIWNRACSQASSQRSHCEFASYPSTPCGSTLRRCTRYQTTLRTWFRPEQATGYGYQRSGRSRSSRLVVLPHLSVQVSVRVPMQRVQSKPRGVDNFDETVERPDEPDFVF